MPRLGFSKFIGCALPCSLNENKTMCVCVCVRVQVVLPYFSH